MPILTLSKNIRDKISVNRQRLELTTKYLLTIIDILLERKG